MSENIKAEILLEDYIDWNNPKNLIDKRKSPVHFMKDDIKNFHLYDKSVFFDKNFFTYLNQKNENKSSAEKLKSFEFYMEKFNNFNDSTNSYSKNFYTTKKENSFIEKFKFLNNLALYLNENKNTLEEDFLTGMFDSLNYKLNLNLNNFSNKYIGIVNNKNRYVINLENIINDKIQKNDNDNLEEMKELLNLIKNTAKLLPQYDYFYNNNTEKIKNDTQLLSYNIYFFENRFLNGFNKGKGIMNFSFDTNIFKNLINEKVIKEDSINSFGQYYINNMTQEQKSEIFLFLIEKIKEENDSYFENILKSIIKRQNFITVLNDEIEKEKDFIFKNISLFFDANNHYYNTFSFVKHFFDKYKYFDDEKNIKEFILNNKNLDGIQIIENYYSNIKDKNIKISFIQAIFSTKKILDKSIYKKIFNDFIDLDINIPEEKFLPHSFLNAVSEEITYKNKSFMDKKEFKEKSIKLLSKLSLNSYIRIVDNNTNLFNIDYVNVFKDKILDVNNKIENTKFFTLLLEKSSIIHEYTTILNKALERIVNYDREEKDKLIIKYLISSQKIFNLFFDNVDKKFYLRDINKEFSFNNLYINSRLLTIDLQDEIKKKIENYLNKDKKTMKNI